MNFGGRWVLLVPLAIVLITIVIVMLLNSESEQVITAVMPLAIGSASALALIFAFAKTGDFERVFPLSVFVDRVNHGPIDIPYRPFPVQVLAFGSVARQATPNVFTDDSDPSGSHAYHEFVQRAFVEVLALRFFGHWRVEKVRFNTGTTMEQWEPMPDADRLGKLVLSSEDLKRLLGANRFAQFDSFGSPGTLALPPGTTLEVDPPREVVGKGMVGVVTFKNLLGELRIETRRSMGMVGIGQYRALLRLPIETAQEKYWQHQFIVTIEGSFTSWLVGNPRMARYREWAEAVRDELAYAFDEERLWQRSFEAFSFQQTLPRGNPQTFEPSLANVTPAPSNTTPPSPPPTAGAVPSNKTPPSATARKIGSSLPFPAIAFTAIAVALGLIMRNVRKTSERQ